MIETFSEILRNEFQKNDRVTLNYIYKKLSENPAIKLDHEKIKTRTRTTIYRLRKMGEIVKVSNATYRKTEKLR